ncbi:MAG: polyprenyl synthetase family protein [Paeniglutamicibacter terrestris]
MTLNAADTSDSKAAREISAEFSERLEKLLSTFLAQQHEVISEIAPAAAQIVTAIDDLTKGGKRLRPLFAFWGYLGAGGDPEANDIVIAGAALELFQAAALIHDDLIDRSDTRRGQPSVHRRFESLHRASGWQRDAQRFGEAASVLAGDLCLSLSEQLFATINPVVPEARSIFDRMRAQVMAGQYLDVLEESAGPSYGPAEAVKRARTIVRYKSAKYSVENPTLLGGALAGAEANLLEEYSQFALPLGEAFQLRDDVLGVFGDPSVTGKPAGDDLREGKRTEIIAHALTLASAADQEFIQSRLGADDLRDDEVERMSALLESCGALAATERSIAELSNQGLGALDELSVPPLARHGLRTLGLAAIRRTS